MEMIHIRNTSSGKEKYEITLNYDKIKELTERIARNCGELRLVKDNRKKCYIPREKTFSYGNEYYYEDVSYRDSGKTTTEWDHYDEYEVPLYTCEYKEYTCPSLVNYIYKLIYEDKDAIETLFKGDFKSVIKFQKVKEKIALLGEEIAECSEKYGVRRKAKLEELNKKYTSINNTSGDLSAKIDGLQSMIEKGKSGLAKMDKEYSTRMKELNEKLEYLLKIEKLNENQEDVSKYLDELLTLIQYRLVDTISNDMIKRVNNFFSEEDIRITTNKPKQFSKKKPSVVKDL